MSVLTLMTGTAMMTGTALVASVCVPSGLSLSAAQFPANSSTVQPGNSSAAQTSAIEILPRVSTSARSVLPASTNVSQHVRQAETLAPGRPRAMLQKPIFGRSDSAGTTSDSQQNLSNSSKPSTASGAASGHSGIKAKQVRRPQGYNYVDAAGIADLPHASSSSVPNADGDARGSRQKIALKHSQDGAEFVIPDENETSARPGSPVPPVPPVPAFPQGSDPDDSPVANPQAGNLPPEHGSSDSTVGDPSSDVASTLIPQSSHNSGSTASAESRPALGSTMHGAAPGTSGFRATVESDAPGWIGPYMGRTGQIPAGPESSPTPVPVVTMPQNYLPWWGEPVQQRAGLAPRSLSVDVTSLVQQALVHSPQVQVLQADPEVQQRVVKQEEATFDWRTFLDAKYDDLNDPIGNTLTTGNNANRFVDQHLYSTGGLKRRTSTGGEVRIAQKFGYQDNNSRFLVPNPQSTSRMELSFRQPLLSQSGTVYSQNQIVLARINANSSGDETLEELQKHLYSVAEAYWKLYRARAEFFQRQRLLTSAQNVLTTLEGRNEVDTIPRQILRARAAVARAESRMQRAVTDIRNAESQLRLLVNDPEMLDGGPVEFTPVEMPYMMASPVGLRDSLQTALVNRPDISYAIRQMRASGVRMGVSKSEMLPKLDFIVSSYVAGLQRNSQFADSFGSQFSDGRPGYTVGMEFEVPLGNRAAKAKVEQRQWELKRAISSFRLTVESSLTEVEISSREVDTAWRELLGKYQAMSAAENEVNYLQDRFAVLPMVEESSMLLLEDLLDGYERLADEEAAFAQAQTNYALSIIQLRRATGTMLRSRHDAPEIDNNESDWMHSRAEQATGDNDSLVAKKSDSREVSPVRALSGNIATKKQSTSDSLDADEKLRAAPVSLSPPPVSKTSAAAQAESSNSPSPSRKPKVGGHSFGNGF
jgi:outer membrane protein TolC